jgi:hypothetical protein
MIRNAWCLLPSATSPRKAPNAPWRMDAVRVCSLQQITEAFFEVGGQYRRNV